MGSHESSTSIHGGEMEDTSLLAIHAIYVLPMAFKAALELGALQIITKYSVGSSRVLSAKDIASRLNISNPAAPAMLDRILRLLACHGIVTCSVDANVDDGSVTTCYGPGPVCKHLATDEDGFSLAPIYLLTYDKVFMESWTHLADAVRDGGVPFNKAFGMSPFAYGRDQDPRFGSVFNTAMSSHSIVTMRAVLRKYGGFQGVKTLVDVGGDVGTALNIITSKYPDTKGINFDLPHVIADAPPYPGVEHVSGDMFVGVPSGDAIMMKRILHDWSDDDFLIILKNCWKALAENGKVIVVDGILPVAPDATLATKAMFSMDLIMLAHFSGGKERTRKEFELLARKAGFTKFTVACYAWEMYVMEISK